MRDLLHCPICFHQLKSTRAQLRRLSQTNKTAHYIHRICQGKPHQLSFFTDKSTGKIDWIQFNPNQDYSTFVEINFVNLTAIVKLYKDSKEYLRIELTEITTPDFPDLEELKKRIELFITFL
jgi:hypothetical protein